MKVRNVVRRLGAVAATGAMVGATAMGALAADLSSYPSMFVTDGTFNGFLVVGENAASVDNLAMTDIAAGMKVSAGSGSVTTVSGDAWMVGTSSKKLEMSNTNATPVGEQIYDIEQFISNSELGALATGSYSTAGSSSSYQQYLYFDVRNNAQNEIVVFAEDDSDVVADFLFVKSGNNIGEYILEFSSSPESTIQDTAGSASSSGTVLDDFENTKLTMLGMEFDVVLARRPQSTPEDSVKLTLMGGAVRGSLLEGESTSMQLRDTTYDVTLTFVDETYVKFTVNGEQTDKLQKGDTHKLADGNEIGVSERLYQSYAGGVHSADFFLGASKVELRDNVITNSASDTSLKVGTETISGADVIVEGTDDNTTFTLTKIHVNMTAQDDYFVPAGGKLSEAIVAQGDDKEMLFTNNWDMEYQGLTEETTHQIRLHSSTDRKYTLQWFDGDNNMVDMPLLYANSSTTLQMSEDATDKGVMLNEALNISKNDYFVVTSGTAADGSAKSFALQYKGADKSTATSPKIKFKNLGSGETLEYAIDTGATSAVATIKLGGNSFVIKNVTESAKTAADFIINVDLNGDGTLADDAPASAEIDIVDKYGVLIDFGGGLYQASRGGAISQPLQNDTRFGFEMNFSVPNANDYDNQAPGVIEFILNATTTNEVTTQSFSSGRVDGAVANSGITPEGEENVAYGMNVMGAKWTYTTPSGSPQEFTLDYPEEQILPQVFITSGATASARTGGNLVTVEGVVGASKLDSEIASVSAQNLIVVGGPCVNTVAAELLGNPADCTEGFRPGVSRVKLFTHANGNVAMLVAGFSGQDTRNAGGFLATRASELTGDEVELEGTTSSDLTVGAPRAVVAQVE
ncbi:MAG: hypothetical protein Q8Q01_00540 [archaeon]|nr:hypothetical protein [archaeon]